MKIIDVVHGSKEWHELRSKTVGASEVAALFDCCPYMTKFALWHYKNGTLDRPELDDNERIKAGQRLERVIAEYVADENEWDIEPGPFVVHPSVEGMSASLDFKIVNEGPAALEIKNIDRLVWVEKWHNAYEEIEAPVHIELQLQHQLAVSELEYGYIGCLIGGNQLHIIKRERHTEVIKQIEQRVAQFWNEIADGKEPEPFSHKDYEFVRKVYNRPKKGKHIDLSNDSLASSLCEVIKAEQETVTAAGKAIDRCKARLLHLMGDAESVQMAGFSATAKVIKRKGYTVDETEYLDLRIKKEKE